MASFAGSEFNTESQCGPAYLFLLANRLRLQGVEETLTISAGLPIYSILLTGAYRFICRELREP